MVIVDENYHDLKFRFVFDVVDPVRQMRYFRRTQVKQRFGMAEAEKAYTVALVGFAQNESATFESFFRMVAARRPPAYRVQEEVADAQLLIVNADNPQAIHLVRLADLPGRVLLIGHNDAGTGWALEKKPVRLVNVLSALDRLVGLRTAVAGTRTGRLAEAAAQPAFQASHLKPLDQSMRRVAARSVPLKPAPALAPKANSEFAPTQPMSRLRGAAVSPRPPVAPARAAAAGSPPILARKMARPGVVRLTDFAGLDDLPALPSSAGRSSRHTRSSQHQTSSAPEPQRGDMLLVSESLVEGRILHKRFSRYGLKIDWSREGKQVAALLKAHPYRLVVIDRVTGEPDAFQICRQARQRRLPNGQPPTVIMFAPSAGNMDRIKAGLAGSDAYLSRSVSEAELYKVLGQHRLVSLDGFAPTDVAY
jgi:CheY-like chemotaxis protein